MLHLATAVRQPWANAGGKRFGEGRVEVLGGKLGVWGREGKV